MTFAFSIRDEHLVWFGVVTARDFRDAPFYVAFVDLLFVESLLFLMPCHNQK